MDPQQQQQYIDPYRALVLSPQPDHLHALQYQQQQPPPPPQPTPLPPPQHHHVSLASHFHILHLVTRLSDAIGTGTKDQTFDALSIQDVRSTVLVSPLCIALGEVRINWELLLLAICFDTCSVEKVEELTSQFARCQQLLNSISGTLSSKSTTVEGQRQSLEETRQLLDQRKDLITKYRSSVEDVLKR